MIHCDDCGYTSTTMTGFLNHVCTLRSASNSVTGGQDLWDIDGVGRAALDALAAKPVRRKSAAIEEQAKANARAKQGFSPANDEGKSEACCNAVNDRIATNPGHSLGWDCDPCNGPCIGANITDDNLTRKRIPMATGLLDMFPRALAQIAELSRYSAEKHAGGVIFLHKHHSDDDANALVRHMADRGTLDRNGFRHSCEAAWRGLAMLEHELEEAEGL